MIYVNSYKDWDVYFDKPYFLIISKENKTIIGRYLDRKLVIEALKHLEKTEAIKWKQLESFFNDSRVVK
ncbi:hypothetical protein J7J62_02335 [bacterium]|nr:hypothetical protein [bacterium]